MELEEVRPEELELIGIIGTGSTAVVHLANYKACKVAVKELQLTHREADDEAVRQAVQRELSVLSAARHPSILRFFGLVPEWPVRLVLEYCEGGSLFDLLHNKRRVRLSWAQRIAVIGDTCLAMKYLHGFEPPIMHRDLKSLNIMLLEPVLDEYMRIHARLADFGYARCFEESGMTRGVGTKHWMAPEVLRSTDYTEKADVFSFAMVVYEAVCRHVPFETVHPDDVTKRLSAGDRPKFEDYINEEEVPRGLIDLATCCWAHRPAERLAFDMIAQVVRQISCSHTEMFSL